MMERLRENRRATPDRILCDSWLHGWLDNGHTLSLLTDSSRTLWPLWHRLSCSSSISFLLQVRSRPPSDSFIPSFIPPWARCLRHEHVLSVHLSILTLGGGVCGWPCQPDHESIRETSGCQCLTVLEAAVFPPVLRSSSSWSCATVSSGWKQFNSNSDDNKWLVAAVSSFVLDSEGSSSRIVISLMGMTKVKFCWSKVACWVNKSKSR